MRNLVVAALGAALIVTIGAGSAARAATINFGVIALTGITYTGSFLEVSTALDLDAATLLVYEVSPGDVSGLTPLLSTVSLSAATVPVSKEIDYGPGTGPAPLGADVTVSWTGSHGAFTETFTTAEAIARDKKMPDEITVTLAGTVMGPPGSGFVDTPVSLALTATQPLGPSTTTYAMFTNASVVPETSTWAMMALGFGALGYAAARRRRTNIAALPA
jgi:MYXO-CTERM domain-containing protein